MAIDPRDIELTEKQRRELARLAERSGKPWTEVFSKALDALKEQSREENGSVERSETLFASLNRRGLLGCIKGGPSDLSTNPEHMKGFGEE